MRKTHTLLVTLVALLFGGVAAAGDAVSSSQCELRFRFDSSALPANARGELERVASTSFAHPELRFVLEGNADDIGTAPYNVGLSIRRALAVRAELVALGVDESKLIIAAYGEDSPRRASHAEDRRVSVTATRDSVASVIARAFKGRGTTVKWDKPMTTAEIEVTPDQTVARR